MNDRSNRKPDIMLVLVALVGLALAVSLTLQLNMLSESGGSRAAAQVTLLR
jgi:hypothetical protein